MSSPSRFLYAHSFINFERLVASKSPHHSLAFLSSQFPSQGDLYLYLKTCAQQHSNGSVTLLSPSGTLAACHEMTSGAKIYLQILIHSRNVRSERAYHKSQDRENG